LDFPLVYLWLLPIGAVIGAFGTLIGAGGGFLLVPLLLLMYPNENPELITSISLAVVFFNALSGSIAYARMGRIDYKSGLILASATVPGAILGAITTTLISRQAFNLIFGIALIAVSLFLFLRPRQHISPAGGVIRLSLHRRVVEADGTVHEFTYNPVVGIGLSLFVGYFSSLLGIGGGIIHVPVLTYLLNFPVHIATATSQFALAIMALTGTSVHVVNGVFAHGVRRALVLSLGVLVGAQVGARLSNRVGGALIIRGLALAMGLVGIRIVLLAL